MKLAVFGANGPTGRLLTQLALDEHHDVVGGERHLFAGDRLAAKIIDRISVLAIENPRVVAVGETGLDYYYDHSPREAQASKAFRVF